VRTDDTARHVEAAADLDFCYLTTTGRVSGRPHRIEIWFGARPGTATLHLLSGGGRRADWVRNLEATPEVAVELAGTTWAATARVLDGPADADEAGEARATVFAKYAARSGDDLTGWRERSLPVALDLRPA
jgi:deazaflavin-dependent oxidoreductase (nitroreductase family)